MSSFENKFGYLKLPLIDIQVATNNFSDENIIGQGGFGKVYWGQLLSSGKLIDIVARRLDRKFGHGEKEFQTEIRMLSNLNHPNIVSIVGYCDEGEEKIIINKFEANGSLDRYLSDPVKLTWTQRLRICLDIARALSYIHYDTHRSFSVIHRNIKSSNILLGGEWEAKLSGFGLSTMQLAARRQHGLVIDDVTGTSGYVDPAYISSGAVTHKSDVYSFGVVLFEVLTGRKAYILDNGKEMLLAQLAKSHYENENLNDIIHPDLHKQMDQGSLKKFSEAAYHCLYKKRSRRPNIDRLILALEQALELQLAHKNYRGNLSHLKLQLSDILEATDGFSDTCCIGSGGFGKVYKAELEHFDDINLLAADGKNEGVLSKKRSTVAIKRVFSRVDGRQEQFLAEIEMLSKCRHPNIVSLLGFCDEESEMILVFEYMSKGSLDDCLGKAFNLTWAQRLQICLDVAHGLNYLHTSTKDKATIIHRDIKSANILLDDKLVAKIADFGLSNLYQTNQQGTFLVTHVIGGTELYLDPEYIITGKLKTKSDIYSFGVVLFEIMCGKLAYDKTYKEKGLASIVQHCFKEGTLTSLLDPKLKEADGTSWSMENRGVNQYSLDTFLEIAYKCLAEKQSDRPTMDMIVEELVKALNIQNYREFAHLAIRLEDILSATNHFDDENLIREGGFGKDYMGQMPGSGQLIDICARRLKCKDGQGDIEFWNEISMLSTLKHRNIISLVGFCDENDEKILVYEYAVHGSLDRHLSGPNLSWFQRLKICLGVAHGLTCIHYDVVHCDINSSKIYLDKDWDPKISGFELSTKYPQSWRHRLLSSQSFDNTTMTPKYDVYCYGVLLFEVLYAVKPTKTQRQGIINPKLREQMDRQSLTFLTNIIDKCLSEHPVQRPTMDQVVKELEDVFELQWKHENLEHSTAADKDHEGTSSGLLKWERPMIPLSEIKAATNGFDEAHFVAGGGFGLVYKGELNVLGLPISSSIEGELQKERTKTSVAIKCIKNRQDVASKQGFLTEIELLTSCKHQNVISLLGLYMEADDIMLVYEYASKGSLSDYLRSTRKNINLTWGKRLEICLDIARGISYLHTTMEGKPRIIHRDIKSENILLDENLNAKIADFGLSKSHSTNQQRSTIQTKHIVGTDFYVDPEYVTSGKYKKESDIYSFGVVLFEMLSGRLAYEQICTQENDKGLAPIARRRFSEKTLKELIDPKMIDDDGEHIVTLNKGPNQESFEAFSRIAYQCLAETQAKRPTMEAVIKELENALNLQGETVVLSRFRLSDILLATQSFSETCCIGLHECGKVYKAELDDFDNKSLLAFKEKSDDEWPKTWPKTRVNVAIKRISGSTDAKQRFFSEIESRTSCKHPNIVNVLGFCDEGDEIILVYEHASNKSLDYYLKKYDNMDNLTWTQRLHMCIGIARGLNHLHTKMDSQERLIHGNITSANILFGKNLEPKIGYFGISEYHLENQKASTLISTQVYRDPEFEKTPVMKKESDVYSFGVMLFEIFCGRLAYDPIYIDTNQNGLPHVASNHFNDGKIKALLDPKLKEVTNDDIFTSNRGPNQDSLDTFLKIAHQCLEEAQAKRPPMEMVIKELDMALNFQENLMKSLQISLKGIELATEKFSQKNYCGSGRYWKAYKGKLPHAAIVANRWDSKFNDQFRTELDILFKRKHKNIISLVGFCNETNEKIIVYEHMSKGSLNKYLKDSNLRWIKRLKICIDVASALEFLHGGDVTLKKVVHRNIKSHSILLNDDWDAKISNFELSTLDSSNQEMEHITDDAYLDPQYKQGLTEKSDIYSLGVVLVEILSGRLASAEGLEDNSQLLGSLAKHHYDQGKLDQMVFEDMKKQIVEQSLSTFADIAYQCLDEDGHMRPQASEVVIQLKKALEFQEDSEIWEPKLPRDYKEIIRLSGTSEIYNKKDIYVKLSEGIHLPKDKVWFILSDNGELNKMISATAAKFTYKNRESHKCRSIHISRFWKVAKMLDMLVNVSIMMPRYMLQV